jgi:hypothetical protein
MLYERFAASFFARFARKVAATGDWLRGRGWAVIALHGVYMPGFMPGTVIPRNLAFLFSDQGMNRPAGATPYWFIIPFIGVQEACNSLKIKKARYGG